jgi:hypothetical protein
MATTCLNCGTALTDKFCAHCGQKASVARISWHHFVEEVVHFFTHIEQGFLTTVALLITKPGLLNKNYLEGKRKSYHKPITFLLIWITVFLLIYHFVNKFSYHEDLNTETLFSNDSSITAIQNKYRTLIELLILPVTCLISWIIVARPKLNYFEVLNTGFYGFSFLFILLSIQFIIAFILSINFHTNSFDNTSVAIFTCWGLYASYDLYKRYKVTWLIPRILLCSIVVGPIYIFLTRQIAKLFIVWNF